MPTDPTLPKPQSYSQPPLLEAIGRKMKGIHLTRMLSAVWRQAALETKWKVNQRQVAQMDISDLIFYLLKACELVAEGIITWWAQIACWRHWKFKPLDTTFNAPFSSFGSGKPLDSCKYISNNIARSLILNKTRHEPRHDKTNKMSVCPAKTKISLGIRPDWSESSLCAEWVAEDLSFLHADNKDWSDWADAQADLSLCWAHSHFVGFVMSCRGSHLLVTGNNNS